MQDADSSPEKERARRNERRRSDPDSGAVRTNDIETHYIRRGDGPPIVFIHGMAMSASQWAPQIAALSSDYTTIAYDVRGHGYTGGSDIESYSVGLYAADLNGLLNALDIDNVILCGLSMGGCIAQAYAATYPEKVTDLVLSDTFTAAPLPLKGRLIFANLRFLGLLDRFVRHTTLNRIQTWIGNRLAPGIAGDRARIQQVMEEAPTISHTEFRKIAQSVARFPQNDFDGAQITAPTLILHGENVPAVLRDMHRRTAEQLVNSPVMTGVIPDAGHASNLDNPTVFTAALAEFASSVNSEE